MRSEVRGDLSSRAGFGAARGRIKDESRNELTSWQCGVSRWSPRFAPITCAVCDRVRHSWFQNNKFQCLLALRCNLLGFRICSGCDRLFMHGLLKHRPGFPPADSSSPHIHSPFEEYRCLPSKPQVGVPSPEFGPRDPLSPGKGRRVPSSALPEQPPRVSPEVRPPALQRPGSLASLIQNPISNAT